MDSDIRPDAIELPPTRSIEVTWPAPTTPTK